MFYSKSFKKLNKFKHCFFSRKNGFSKGIYKSMNCGLGSKDKKINVNKNLNKISNILGVKVNNLKLMNQTHSAKVVFVNKKNQFFKRFKSDALITNLKGVALAVLTADCVPILIIDKKNNFVACIHAGWKGALKGIIERTVKILLKKNKNCELIAAVGPCISKESYEVDKNFRNKFKKIKNYNKFFKKTKTIKYKFDLRKFVNYKLIALGVKKIDNINRDTLKNNNLFFSYRRSVLKGEKDYGRCLSAILLN